MAGTEIANAYVALSVKMPGVQNQIAQSLGASNVAAAVKGSGKTMGQRLVDGFAPIAKVGLAAIGTVAAAGLGTALVKGFQRLDAIDAASAKLRGLGHDAKSVDTIMANALASVKGTSFGLGDAATVAAQAVAAGIKPGQELEGVLKSVANSAAAAGTDLGDMGSIYAKVASIGKAQNDVLQQVADRGIPIYATLAKQLGVTADEVFKMASAGKIGFAEFEQAMTAASGTVAAEMGGTWSGLFDNMMASLGRIGEGLLSGIFPQMKDGVSGLTDVFGTLEEAAKPVGEAIGNFFTWIKENKDLVGTLAAGIGTLVGVVTAIYTGVKLWTAAQLLLNTALLANPIGAIVMGLSALVGAIVWFFTQTELGKAIWEEFTRFLGEAWTNISNFFIDAWENVIEPVFNWIGEAAVWVYETILKPVFDGIAAVVGFLAAAFKVHFDAIVIAFRVVGAIVNWLWLNVVQPVFNFIGEIVSWVWTSIISPIFTAIGGALKILGDAFNWLWVNIIQPVWQGIQSAIDTAWKWINTNVFTPMKTGIDAVGKAFDAVGKFIGEVWTNIQNAAKAPVRFLIDTVWNNGIRSFAVDVLKALGLNDLAKGLPRVSMPFAQGGVLPGYTPGRDVHEFYSPTGGRLSLSGGEAIMRPEFTRAVGGAAGVARLNAMARKGQAFKDGGVWGDIGSFAGDVWDNIAGAASVAWEFITDPVGAVRKHMSGFINGLGGNGAFSDIVAGVPKTLLRGFEQMFENTAPKGVGTAGMGWEAMWQIVQNAVPGAVMTSNYRPGARTVNGGKSYHGAGRAIDLVPASMDIFNAVARLFPNASELIYSPAGNRQLLNGKPFNGWSDAVRRQHYDHVHLAMANGGVVPKLYDQGGWLPSGGMAVNKSGKPEAVLTPAQSEALVNGGFPRELVIVDADRQLIGRMQVEADARISSFDSAQERVSRGRVR